MRGFIATGSSAPRHACMTVDLRFMVMERKINGQKGCPLRDARTKNVWFQKKWFVRRTMHEQGKPPSQHGRISCPNTDLSDNRLIRSCGLYLFEDSLRQVVSSLISSLFQQMSVMGQSRLLINRLSVGTGHGVGGPPA